MSDLNRPGPSSRARTLVIDAGGRYGVHPSWKQFRGELQYVLFEPDVEESQRLKSKYAGKSNIEVMPMALGEKPGTLRMNVLRHRGQSTAFAPNPRALWFEATRPSEGDVVASYDAPMTSIDVFCEQRALNADFLKIDVEGAELSILRGARRQLEASILGLRCELQFDDVFVGAPSMADVYSYLRAAGFLLLNLDYSGAGAHASPFFQGPRYGLLSGSDSVWIRPPRAILEEVKTQPERVLKYAAFCMHNDATDVALYTLLKAVNEHGLRLGALESTGLAKDVDISVQRLFHTLGQKPAYDFQFLDQAYHRIFGRRLKRMHEYFESDEINPD